MYRGAQTTTLLGGEGERGKSEGDRVNCPKKFGLHCSLPPTPLNFCITVVFDVS